MKKVLSLVLVTAVLITVMCSTAFASSESLFIGEEGNPVSNGIWEYNEERGTWSYATTEPFTSVLAYIVNPYAGNEAQWFLFDVNGILQSGWVSINGKECYFNTQHDGSFGAFIPQAQTASGSRGNKKSNQTADSSVIADEGTSEIQRMVINNPLINSTTNPTQDNSADKAQVVVRGYTEAKGNEMPLYVVEGVQVGTSQSNGNGTPGGGATIRIRGGGSINESDPLIIIE